MMKILNKISAFGRAFALKWTLLRLHRSRFGRYLFLAGATTKPTNDTFVSNRILVGELKGIGELAVVAGLNHYHYTVTVGKRELTWAIAHTSAERWHYSQMYETAMVDWDVEFENYESVIEKLRAATDPKVIFLAENTEIEFCR